MPKVLVVASADLTPELGKTILWRSDIERIFAPDVRVGLEVARRTLPGLIVLDGADTGAAVFFVETMRKDPAARRVSIAVLSRSPSVSDEEVLRRAGANVVLAGEVDPFLWDSRLEELLLVPRRREARFPVSFGVWSHLSPDFEPIEGQAVNISVGGMLLETREPADVGTKLELAFTLPDDSEELHVVGQVVREALAPEGRFRSGVEFMIQRSGARERIRSFVEAEARR